MIAGGLDDRTYMRRLTPLLNDRVVMLGSVRRSSMRGLYSNALFFVNCSLHEGQSNAVLEAISFQCPVLLSDIPENRDFGLDAKHYFDPYDVDSVANALTRISVKATGYCVSEEGFLKWDDVAEQTARIYQGVLMDRAADAVTYSKSAIKPPAGEKI